VDDQRNAGLARDLRNRLQIGNRAAGIGQRFNKDRLAARRQRLLEILGPVGIDEMDMPIEFLEGQSELGHRAAIKAFGGDEFIARLHQREEGHELSRVARSGCSRAASAFQSGDTLLQNRDGRIAEAAVDVAEGPESVKRGSLIGIVEDIGDGLIDRRGARTGGGTRGRARMHSQGGEAGLFLLFAHRPASSRRLLEMMRELTPPQLNSRLSRPYSIFGQRFMMTVKPASSARRAAASLRTPICIQTTLAPMAMASSSIGGTAAEARKMSTISTLSGIPRSEA